MFIKKKQIPLLVINTIAIIIFTIIFVKRANYEFLMYIGVIIFFLLVIIATNKKVNYPLSVLYGLSFWALMHMAGGGLYLGGLKLYELIIVDLVGDPYYIFRYDQLVHIIGFGVATLLMYYLLKPLLLKPITKNTSLAIVVIMAGLGVGAVNEIIEFIATVIMPETGVGGYENTSLDLVADLIGAILAFIYLKIFELNNNKKNI